MKLFQISKLRRLFPKIIALFLLLSSIGYTYLWFKQAHWLEARVHHEITLLQTNQETTLDHEGVKVTGFPWKLEVKIRNPRLTFTRGGSGLFQVDGQLEIESTLFSPQTIVVNGLGKTKFIYAPTSHLAPLMLEVEDFQGSLKIQSKNYLLNALKLYDLHLKMHENRINVEEFSLSALPQKKLIRPSLTSATTVASQKQTLPDSDRYRSFALKIYRMKVNQHSITKLLSLLESLEAIVHLEETFNPLVINPFQEWAKKGGVLEIEKLAFEWGPLNGEGDGTLALDPDLQPLAAFSLKISGLEPLLDQLAHEKIIRKNVALIAKLSLGLLQNQATPRDEAPSHKVALSLQKGDLSIGPLTIVKLPKIEWPSR